MPNRIKDIYALFAALALLAVLFYRHTPRLRKSRVISSKPIATPGASGYSLMTARSVITISTSPGTASTGNCAAKPILNTACCS